MGQKRHVPHFAPGTYRTFAVVMHVGAGKAEQPTTFDIPLDRLCVLANEIDHGCWIRQQDFFRWQTRDGSNLLFELRDIACIQGVMPGVMRSGRDFIDEHALIRQQKQLKTKQSDPVHTSDHRPGEVG